jgi:uracil-DNA glycosylase family 4
MSLMLDARQRAMLEEMGVKVWWPAQTAEVAAPVAAAETTQAAEPAALVGEPAVARAARPPMDRPGADTPHAPPSDDAPPAWLDDVPPEDMPSFAAAPSAPRQEAPASSMPGRRPAAEAPASATAPPSPRTGAPSPRAGTAPAVRIEHAPRLYLPAGAGGDAPAPGGWLVLVDMPPGPDGRHGAAFAGDAGRLLDQMLRALRLHAGPAPVHLQRVHRPAPGVPEGEDDEAFEAGFGHACRELAPRMVLALGPLAAQQLLGAQPLGRLRAQVGRCADGRTAVVASYAPAYLLRTPTDKARAWADLCLAAAEFERIAAAP